jgi:hypothetical protein
MNRVRKPFVSRVLGSERRSASAATSAGARLAKATPLTVRAAAPQSQTSSVERRLSSSAAMTMSATI